MEIDWVFFLSLTNWNDGLDIFWLIVVILWSITTQYVSQYGRWTCLIESSQCNDWAYWPIKYYRVATSCHWLTQSDVTRLADGLNRMRLGLAKWLGGVDQYSNWLCLAVVGAGSRDYWANRLSDDVDLYSVALNRWFEIHCFRRHLGVVHHAQLAGEHGSDEDPKLLHFRVSNGNIDTENE